MSPRCHSLSIFVYVIFTMSKIVLRNVYVCLNVYLCPRLSIIVYNCLWMSQDIVYCLFSVCNNLAISTFELFSFSISLHQHHNYTPTAMSITTTHTTPWQNWTDGDRLLLSWDRAVLLLLEAVLLSNLQRLLCLCHELSSQKVTSWKSQVENPKCNMKGWPWRQGLLRLGQRSCISQTG